MSTNQKVSYNSQNHINAREEVLKHTKTIEYLLTQVNFYKGKLRFKKVGDYNFHYYSLELEKTEDKVKAFEAKLNKAKTDLEKLNEIN